MAYKKIYNSPLGNILLVFDEENLLGLYMESQEEYVKISKNSKIKYYKDNFSKSKILKESEKWLDLYFSGKDPGFLPALKVQASEFRKDVWDILLKIPYGEKTTYKEITEILVKSGKYKNMSAQAVGGAVGHNPILLIIPCHRVMGSDGSLRGYAGGIDVKRKLLEIEGNREK